MLNHRYFASLLILAIISSTSAFASIFKSSTPVDFKPYLSLVGIQKKGHLYKSREQINLDPRPNGEAQPKTLAKALRSDIHRLETDPTFPCERPASTAILLRLAKEGKIPAIEKMGDACYVSPNLRLTGYAAQIRPETHYGLESSVDFHPEQILEVAYVNVLGARRKISQIAGHALLKITLCASGEDPAMCRQALDHQFAIGYRAANHIFARSRTDMPFGPLQGSLFSWSAILQEYPVKDNRPMQVYPLNLDADQRRLLGLAFLEKRRTDSSAYDFTLNNCMHGAMELLNVALSGDKQLFLRFGTPSRLATLLVQRGLVNASGISSIKGGIDDLNTLLATIASRDPSFGKHTVAEISKLDFAQRKTLWEGVLAESKDEKEVVALAIADFENILMEKAEVKIARKVKDLVTKARRKPASLNASERAYIEMSRKIAFATELSYEDLKAKHKLLEQLFEKEFHEVALMKAFIVNIYQTI